MAKDDFSKKELQEMAQEAVDNNVVKNESASEYFRAQVHEKDIRLNDFLPKTTIVGVSPEIDNEARNLANHFKWVTSNRYDLITEKILKILDVFGVEIKQRRIHADHQSIRFRRVVKNKRFLAKFFRLRSQARKFSNSKSKQKDKKIVEFVREILEIAA